MKVERFENMFVWQKSKELCLTLYKLFSSNQDYRFKDQIQSAAVSIMNNIAEGFERKGNKEFRKFLYISKGSCAEVKSMLYLAIELSYISKSDFDKTFNLSTEISKMLTSFIAKMII